MLKLHFGHEREAGARSLPLVHGYVRGGPQSRLAEHWLREITSFCAVNGLAIGEVYVDDGPMGDATESPALSALLSRLEETGPEGSRCHGVVVAGDRQLSWDRGVAEALTRRIWATGSRLIVVDRGVSLAPPRAGGHRRCTDAGWPSTAA